MRRRTFFMLMCYVRGFACTWMALRARNPSPSGLATLNPQSTCHGPRPGLILAPWYTDGLPACPGAESARKDPRPEEKKCRYAKKAHLYMVILVRTFEYLIQVVHLRQGNKSESSTSTVRGPRKREVRSHQASRLYTGVNDLQYKQ